MIRGMDANALWQIVDETCHDEREQLVARLSFVANLKPRRIIERYPQLFDSEDSLYKLRKNLLKRLRRNPQLLEMLEL